MTKYRYISNGAYLEGLPVPAKGELLDDETLTYSQKLLLEMAVEMKMYQRSNPVDEAEAVQVSAPKEDVPAAEATTAPSVGARSYEKATRVKKAVKDDEPET